MRSEHDYTQQLLDLSLNQGDIPRLVLFKIFLSPLSQLRYKPLNQEEESKKQYL